MRRASLRSGGLREGGGAAYRLASEKLEFRRESGVEGQDVKVWDRFGRNDGNVMTEQNARDRERAHTHALGCVFVAALILMRSMVMARVVVMGHVRRCGGGSRHARAEDDRKPGRIRGEHEPCRHEHAREQQWQQPQSPTMEMRTFHAGRKYTSM